MTITTKLLVALYSLCAVLALAMSWAHLPAYFGSGFLNANIQFWGDALFNANPAGKFLSVDILFLAFICNVWMFIEGRRLGVKYLYAYILIGVVVAISFAFPLFMAARELRLAAQEGAPADYKIKAMDAAVLILIFLITVVASVATF
ncbi:Uncharacterised protein [Zhongshania aliphaticivorans]|uniref:DUF2834 domain-containing protein n=1 Tax=Zhongshania aliphaticivorans TaxID=1470434 RepID=A0A5S9N829_9GAMM|nr:DUF2834 domain-containing protein [Zhongshania aliphaticivorans]CAA0080422.1 Uncharacterised protein [Zhongshania aliphaticivorans]CAA0085737.1 Uncharacterised protein [Zhongshania aliphaticivorans]